MSRENLYSIFKREHLDSDLLAGFSAVLNMPVSEILNEPIPVDVNPQFTPSVIMRTNTNQIERVRTLPYISVKGRYTLIQYTPERKLSDFIEESIVILPRIDVGEKHFVFEIDGDAMDPELRSGAIVLAEQVDRADYKYEANGVFVVVYAGRFAIKRIKANEIADQGRLVLVSDNPKYGPISVSETDIRMMWKVLRIIDSVVL